MRRHYQLTFMYSSLPLFPHSTEFSGGACHRSSKASGRENLEVEQPVACWDCSSLDFHATLPPMLGTTLVGYQVVQVCQSGEKRLLAATWMMEAFHCEQFPLDGVMRLIQERAGHGHLRVFEHRIPARLLLLEPTPYPLPIGHPCLLRHMVGKVA